MEINTIDEKKVDAFYKVIGLNVKKIREKNGYSQLDLSNALGFKSVGLVSQAELYINKQHFNLKHLYLISKIFNCEMKCFFENIE